MAGEVVPDFSFFNKIVAAYVRGELIDFPLNKPPIPIQFRVLASKNHIRYRLRELPKVAAIEEMIPAFEQHLALDGQDISFEPLYFFRGRICGS